jgi:ABC-2 type transport system ATP-binding protein
VMRDETLGLLVEHLAETPTTVLISTHLVHETETLADHVAMLRSGELRAELPVNELRQRLRRYQAEVPADWRGLETLNGALVQERRTGREIEWTIWGEEREVVERLTSSGATVRNAAPLTLEEATLSLLSKDR